MLKVLTKRERIILYLTMAVIIFSIVFSLGVAPVLRKNEMLNKEIVLARAKLKKYLRLLAQKEYIQDKYKQSSAVPELAISEDPLVCALAELENLAKGANIRIVDIRPQGPKKAGLYQEILIDLTTEGTMDEYLKFIYDIENSLFMLKIKKMQLNAKPNTPALEGIFTISGLSLPE